MANVGHVIGTGIFSHRMNPTTFKQQLQTSINLPSMQTSEIPSTAAGNGGPQSNNTSNALNITSLESNSVKQNLLKTAHGSIRAKARKHSVFSISNVSGNITETTPKDANKTQQILADKQAVAWEIKFKPPDKTNVATEKDYKYTDIKNLRITQNKSPQQSTKRQLQNNFQFMKPPS